VNNLLAWVATALLCIAPFFIDTTAGKVCALFALAMLCPQAYEKRAYNLILLNSVGIIGYLWSVLK
jgi:hypothetical protein